MITDPHLVRLENEASLSPNFLLYERDHVLVQGERAFVAEINAVLLRYYSTKYSEALCGSFKSGRHSNPFASPQQFRDFVLLLKGYAGYIKRLGPENFYAPLVRTWLKDTSRKSGPNIYFSN